MDIIKTAKQNYLKRNGFEAMHLKAVLFDMDGILFDSMPNHARSWTAVATKFGLNMSTEEAYLHEGRTGADTINILTKRQWGREATPKEIQDIYKAKCITFNEKQESPKMPGAIDVLRKVKQCKLSIGVVTGSGQHSLLERLEKNYPGFFNREQMVTCFDVMHGKPHPEPYLKGLNKIHVQPWEAIVIENAPLGIQAGTAAKIFTIAINTGPLSDRILTEAGADLLFPSMEILAKMWKQLYLILK